MRKFIHVVFYSSIIIGSWYVVVSQIECDETVAEQTPKLYCWYSAGYGKRVWVYEDLGQGDIITDADDVFHMSACKEWKEYVDGKR